MVDDPRSGVAGTVLGFDPRPACSGCGQRYEPGSSIEAGCPGCGGRGEAPAGQEDSESLRLVLTHIHRSGRYEILEKLGQGGMGALFRARDRQLEREVAIKLLLGGGPDHVARFEREGKLLARLTHPNLLQIFAVEPVGQVPVLVLELLRGKTVGSELASGQPLPWRRAVEITGLALEGLAVAHEAGIVHRDVKPENLFLPDEGGLKVLDFGLAREVGLHAPGLPPSLTATGIIMGTPAYMSPEQCRAEPVDARTDLYSLGVVLFQLLTGRLPFTGASALDVLAAHVRDAAPLVSLHVSGLPSGLVELVSRALEKDPGRRFPDARVMARDLKRASARTTDRLTTARRTGPLDVTRVGRMKPVAPESDPDHPDGIPSRRPVPGGGHLPTRSMAGSRFASRTRARAAVGIGAGIAVLLLTVFRTEIRDLALPGPDPAGSAGIGSGSGWQSVTSPRHPGGGSVQPGIRAIDAASGRVHVWLTGPAPEGTELTLTPEGGLPTVSRFVPGRDHVEVDGLRPATRYEVRVSPDPPDSSDLALRSVTTLDRFDRFDLLEPNTGKGISPLGVASHGDRLTAAWIQRGSSRGHTVWLCESSDGGRCWSRPVRIDRVPSWKEHLVVTAGPRTVHVAWDQEMSGALDSGPGEWWACWLSSRAAPDGAWTEPVQVPTIGYAWARPDLYLGEDGDLELVYRGSPGPVSIVRLRATDGSLIGAVRDIDFPSNHIDRIRTARPEGRLLVFAQITHDDPERPKEIWLAELEGPERRPAGAVRRVSEPGVRPGDFRVCASGTRVTLAYESSLGLRVRWSEDAGRRFAPPESPFSASPDSRTPALAASGDVIWLAAVTPVESGGVLGLLAEALTTRIRVLHRPIESPSGSWVPLEAILVNFPSSGVNALELGPTSEELVVLMKLNGVGLLARGIPVEAR